MLFIQDRGAYEHLTWNQVRYTCYFFLKFLNLHSLVMCLCRVRIQPSWAPSSFKCSSALWKWNRKTLTRKEDVLEAKKRFEKAVFWGEPVTITTLFPAENTQEYFNEFLDTMLTSTTKKGKIRHSELRTHKIILPPELLKLQSQYSVDPFRSITFGEM
jgi:hypothetical protein